MADTKLINEIRMLLNFGYSDEYIEAKIWENRSYSLSNIKHSLSIAKGEYPDKLINKEVTDPNKFMKILVECGVNLEQLKDYKWFVNELHANEYHCTGYHPMAARIDIIKSEIVIH